MSEFSQTETKQQVESVLESESEIIATTSQLEEECELENAQEQNHCNQENGDDNGAENNVYGYEEAEPRNRWRQPRRNSLIGRIMHWAGAVNQEQFEASTCSGGTIVTNTNVHRRSSVDYVERASGADGEHEEECGKHSEEATERATTTVYNKASRRDSLHAMVEKAMAFVNLRNEPNDDELCPFGTRRDSLFS
jgi:hypothetical protein